MVTRRKRWSTNQGSGWPRGSSLVVQVSGGALTRTSSVALTIKIKSKFSGKLRVDTIFEQGSEPCSFFFERFLFRGVFFATIANGNDGIVKSDRAKFRTGRRALRGSDAAGLAPAVRRCSRSAHDCPRQ